MSFLLTSLICFFNVLKSARSEKILTENCLTKVAKNPEFIDAKTHYCGNITLYSVPYSNLKNETANTEALKTYTTIYEKYLKNKSNEDEFSGVTLGCLGILRKLACAKEFPYCDPKTLEVRVGVVCKNACNLLSSRCPTEKDLIKYICDK